MNKPNLTRRDFLKLLSTVPLAYLLGNQKTGLDVSPNSANSIFPASETPNILILVFDAWSASNMSLYGYPRQTTPILESLAKRAIVFHNHFAAGNFTNPGTASLLTGLYPWTHRAMQFRSQVLDKISTHNIFHFFSPNYHRFAYTQNLLAYINLHQFRHDIDHFPNPGHLAIQYRSLTEKIFYENYYSANEAKLLLKSQITPSASLLLSLIDHLETQRRSNQLASIFSQEYPRGLIEWGYLPKIPAYTYLLEDAIDWIIQQTSSSPQPFLGYVHLLPPHDPYNPRIEFTRLFNEQLQTPSKPQFRKTNNINFEDIQKKRQEYDQHIAFVDSEFGRLYRSLEAKGILNNTVIVLTSDHGEMFERGIVGHVHPALFQPVIRVPLLFFLPEKQTRTDIYTPTSATDLLPTLLRMIGSSAPLSAEGFPLPFDTVSNLENRSVFAVDSKENSRFTPLSKASFAMIKWPYKLIIYLGNDDIYENMHLYNLSDDPEEIHNLYFSHSSIAQEMQTILMENIPSAARPDVRKITP